MKRAWIALVALAVACGTAQEPVELGVVEQALQTLPVSGFVPYPIRFDTSASAPSKYPDGSFVPAWDGSLAELVAADAYANCAVTSAHFGPYGAALAGQDLYLQRLVSLMGQFACKPAVSASGSVPAYASSNVEAHWTLKRGMSECNVNSDGKPTVLEYPPTRDVAAYATFFSATVGSLGITNQSTQTNFDAAKKRAGQELAYADLNLCIAQQVRGKLNSGQSLFLSTQDQAELNTVVSERSKLSMTYYALLAKVTTAPSVAKTINAPLNQFLVILRAWAEGASSDTNRRLGDDFALAVKLHEQATLESARFFQRLAASRPTSDLSNGRADRDWGAGQPRLRLLNLLYGGDPMGGSQYYPLPGRSRGGVGRGDTVPPYVSAPMANAQVGTLLGLARSTDSLFFKVSGEPGSITPGFDVTASADGIFRRVEAGLRAQACELSTPGQAACDRDVILGGLPSALSAEGTLAWQQHRVLPEHATILATAFEQAFGEVVKPPYIISPRENDGLFHLAGKHCTHNISGASWVHIDPQFEVLPYSGIDLSYDFTEGTWLPRQLVLDARPDDQGFVVASSYAAWQPLRNLGAVPALAFVREALVEMSGSPIAPSFVSAAGKVLADVERMVGSLTVAARYQVETATVPCNQIGMPATPTTVACKYTRAAMSGSDPKLEVNAVTTPSDILSKLALPPDLAQVHTVALDPATVTFQGVDRSYLDWAPTVAASVTSVTTGEGAGREFRRFLTTQPTTPILHLMLRGEDTTGATHYLPLFHHNLSGAHLISSGGVLNGLAESAFRVLSNDWSTPAVDAFGLPANWVPPADASLVGGVSGDPAYRYYLQAAKDSAAKATTAVQEAIDNLVAEELEKKDLAAAEQRAESIVELENRAFCDDPDGCSVPLAYWNPAGELTDCAIQSDATDRKWCTDADSMLRKILSRVKLAKVVADADVDVAPSFQDYAGSDLQQILIRQWSAMRAIRTSMQTFFDQALAAGRHVATAEAASDNASDELVQVNAEVATAIASLDLQGNQGLANAVAEFTSAQTQLNSNLAKAEAAEALHCSPGAFDAAKEAGYTYSDVEVGWWGGVPSLVYDEAGQVVGGRVDQDLWSYDSMSWNAGPAINQIMTCLQATSDAGILASQAPVERIAYSAKLQLVVAQLLTVNPLEREALAARSTAAYSRRFAAEAARLEAVRVAYSQLSSGLSQIQSQVEQLALAIAELARGMQQLQATESRQNLEVELARVDAKTRHGLRRLYSSYDVWRARAMLASARRLAVAARRSIESHFVVNLSDLATPQAFVESPSLWADEVYSDDLNAPSVVGLSVAPESSAPGTVYPNKLTDYVDNLERFVQGYTISYPTAVAAPDTEVLSLPGLETTIRAVDEVGPFEVLAEEGLGWSYFCADTGGWVGHPGVGQAKLTSRLSTLCGGKPPSKAAYRFHLDPWGRLDVGFAAPPMEQRHNVRWRQLAVNLVGTGIRDCEAAADSDECYSQPFVRFDLRHYGPSWATNHTQEWRTLDLPEGLIEGGKALATEEWVDPVVNSWDVGFVSNVARAELSGRPVSGAYELTLDLTPDVRLDRIERIQILAGMDYWVRQEATN